MGWFWWFMLVTDLIIPLTMLGMGLHWLRGQVPPYGGASGYRTQRSLASPAAWQFAHLYCGRLWAILGLALLPPSVLVMMLCRGTDRVGFWGGILCTAQVLIMAVPIPLTEGALRRMGG